MPVLDLSKIPIGARPDLIAHDHSARIELDVAAKELVDLLGERLVAYICGVSETRTVREWADGKHVPRDPAVHAKLRSALHIGLTVTRKDHPHLVASWFQGLNPLLDDRSPARLLREGELAEVGPWILSAARAFVSEG